MMKEDYAWDTFWALIPDWTKVACYVKSMPKSELGILASRLEHFEYADKEYYSKVRANPTRSHIMAIYKEALLNEAVPRFLKKKRLEQRTKLCIAAILKQDRLKYQYAFMARRFKSWRKELESQRPSKTR